MPHFTTHTPPPVPLGHPSGNIVVQLADSAAQVPDNVHRAATCGMVGWGVLYCGVSFSWYITPLILIAKIPFTHVVDIAMSRTRVGD